MQDSYLHISDAVELTSLTSSTLERFITSGYIQSQSQGEDLYLLASDLEHTFGVAIPIKDEIESKDEDENQDEEMELEVSTVEKEIQTSSNSEQILQKALEMQERLIDEKDSKINEQQKEINWLRKRIEKLEDSAEKDKILLLSSNQTLQQLIESDVYKRTNPLKRALGWFSKK